MITSWPKLDVLIQDFFKHQQEKLDFFKLLLFFFYQNRLFKNIRSEIWPKIKNILRTYPGWAQSSRTLDGDRGT